MKSLGVLLSALAFTLTASATASVWAQSDSRDADIFGEPAPEESPKNEAPAEKEKSPEGGDQRDAEVFGEPGDAERENPSVEPVPEPGPVLERPTDDAMFGGGQGAESALLTKVTERNDMLDIGGQIFLRLEYSYLDDTRWQTLPLSSPNLVDLYMDARPTERLRAYFRGRVRHDFTLQQRSSQTSTTGSGDPGSTVAITRLGTGGTRQPTQVFLDQLWFKYDVGEVAFVTLGRQPIRWGSGRFWNPTDFMNARVRDPLAVFDERTGVGLLKVHVPVESLGWNFYGVLNFDGMSMLEDVGAAVRGEFLFAETEIALSVSERKNAPLQFGFDITSALGWFDVRLEAALSTDVRRTFYETSVRYDADPVDDVFDNPTDPSEAELALALADFQSSFVPPETRSLVNKWIPQITAGAEIQLPYGEQDSVILGAEYFFNDAGYDNADRYETLLLFNAFTPLYLGRHYASVYASLPSPGTWNNTTFTLSGLSNLSDQSFLTRLDYSINVLRFMRVNAFGALHFGNNGEFHFSTQQQLSDLSAMRVNAGLANGTFAGLTAQQQLFLSLLANGTNAPVYDVGLGFTMAF